MANNAMTATVAFIGGALVGATLGILFAPEKGSDQRKKIKQALEKRGIKLSTEEFNKLVKDLAHLGKKEDVVPSEELDFDVE